MKCLKSLVAIILCFSLIVLSSANEQVIVNAGYKTRVKKTISVLKKMSYKPKYEKIKYDAYFGDHNIKYNAYGEVEGYKDGKSVSVYFAKSKKNTNKLYKKIIKAYSSDFLLAKDYEVSLVRMSKNAIRAMSVDEEKNYDYSVVMKNKKNRTVITVWDFWGKKGKFKKTAKSLMKLIKKINNI